MGVHLALVVGLGRAVDGRSGPSSHDLEYLPQPYTAGKEAGTFPPVSGTVLGGRVPAKKRTPTLGVPDRHAAR